MAFTWNPSDKDAGITLSNGNLTAENTSSALWRAVRSIFSKSSGKWYWELTINVANDDNFMIGFGTSSETLTYPGATAAGYGYRGATGDKYHNSVYEDYGDAYTASNIIGIALDFSNGKGWWRKNGIWQASGDPAAGTNEAYSGISGTFFAMVSLYQAGNKITANFGATDFAYSIPDGFSAPSLTIIVAEPLTANSSLQAFPLVSIPAEAFIANAELSANFFKGHIISAPPFIANGSLSASYSISIPAEPLIATASLSGSPMIIIPAAPLTASSSMSASIKYFLVSTISLVLGIELGSNLNLVNALNLDIESQLRLLNDLSLPVVGIEVGSTLTLINSLNLDLESQLNLLNNILVSLEGDMTLKMRIYEFIKAEGSLGLLNHIYDDDMGITVGEYIFDKTHS